MTLGSLVLLPQLLARLYERKDQLVQRTTRLWAIAAAGTVLAAGLTQMVGYPIKLPSIIGVIAVFAVLIFVPMWHGWGFRISRAAWCCAGVAAAILYVGAAAVAHRAALHRVVDFARSQHLEVQALAALPLPPSLWQWHGLIRTPRGVYELRMDLARRRASDPGPQDAIEYAYYPDAPENPWIEEARRMPQVKIVLWFARFPVTRFRHDGQASVVDFLDLRFRNARPGQPSPFTYRVRFDLAGRVLSQGWVRP